MAAVMIGRGMMMFAIRKRLAFRLSRVNTHVFSIAAKKYVPPKAVFQ